MTNTTASAPFFPLPPFRRVSDLLRDNARQRPQAKALADDDSALDWAALDALVDRVAASLQQAGLHSGDVVAVCAASSVRYAAVYLGALRAGEVVAPLAPSVTPEAMASMLGDAQARLLFADAQGRTAVPPAVMEGAGALPLVALDDADALHVRLADQSVALDATGAGAYLDGARIIAIARRLGCDAIHPGYGFLSERADFAQACADADLMFIGPTVQQLELFGDKATARARAERLRVPLLPGSVGAVTLAEAQAFMAAQHGAGVMLKAIGGGGGRGMRAVRDAAELPEAFARCSSEARAAFGVEGVYAERLMANARHVEVQVIGDGDQAMTLGDRECSLQRRFQKLVEIAPSPSLPAELRDRITRAALQMAEAVRYRSLGTFEFLVDESSAELPFVFIEANPRVQVEHTVTEAVTGLDLVRLQIESTHFYEDPTKPTSVQVHKALRDGSLLLDLLRGDKEA